MKSYKNKIISSLGLSVLVLVVVGILPQSVEAIGFGNALEVRADVKVKNVKVENKNSATVQVETDQDGATTSDSDLDYKNDDNLPKGIRTAPGIEKRVEEGKWLPKGILKFWNRNDDGDEGGGEVEVKIKIVDF